MNIGSRHRKLRCRKKRRGAGRKQACFANHASILKHRVSQENPITMATIADQLNKDIILAMKAKEADRLTTLRMVKSGLQSKEIDKREPLTDAEEQAALTTMLKQRRDSIEQFTKGGREELAEKERVEIVLIEAYMPKSASEEDINTLVAGAVQHIRNDNAGAPLTPKDMGSVMKVAQQRALASGARIDGKVLSEKVKAALAEG
jgi:uncharacterized protein YqeY